MSINSMLEVVKVWVVGWSCWSIIFQSKFTRKEIVAMDMLVTGRMVTEKIMQSIRKTSKSSKRIRKRNHFIKFRWTSS